MVNFELCEATELEHHSFCAHDGRVCSFVDFDNACFLLSKLDFSLKLNDSCFKFRQSLTDLAIFVTLLLHLVPQRRTLVSKVVYQMLVWVLG